MEIGSYYKLKIKEIRPFGAILEGHILLPKKELPEGAKAGDELEIFLLKDKEGRPVATLKKARAQLGQMAVLPVTSVSKPGAFLDWGLDKDLFLPYSEQTRRVREGDWLLVYVYLDKSGRLAATMKTKGRFSYPKDMKENDRVEGVAYLLHPDYGAFILVEGKYSGLLPKTKMKSAVQPGQPLTLRVERIKADGKIDLSMLSRTYERLDEDARQIYKTLKANHGFLRVNDHTDPQKIQMLFAMSKGQFKRAVGRLLKQGAVEFYRDGLRIKEKPGTNHRNKKQE